MKAVLLLLALIGSACALQYPVEYHYRYSGRIATGIPSIRPQVSATGIRAKLILQMKTRTQAIAKLTDVEVGEYNGDATCVQLRQPIPIRYSPLKKYSQVMEEPFGVNFAEQTGHVMTVPKSDLEFITNIRKSVIEILRVKPIVERLGGMSKDPIIQELNKDSDYKVFSEQEETIFGRCENQYTLTPLPAHLAQEEKEFISKNLVKDHQRERSGARSEVPSIGDKLYRLVKAVDFDKCHEHVILMHSGIANISKAGHGQFDSVQSRSSVATYILRGDGNNFRVEKAVVEGDMILNPFGSKLNRLQAITNQTLTLESAESISTQLRLPTNTRNVKTWRYEVASPFSPPSGSPKIWVNYYGKGDRLVPVPPMSYMLGLFPTPEISQKYKAAIENLLNEIVEVLESHPKTHNSKNPNPMNTRGSVATSNLYTISKMMRSLHLKDVEEIFSRVFEEKDTKGEKKQMILVDVAAASGASAPLKVLLEKIERGQISSTRAASIFATLTNHLISPVLVPELMKFAMKVDMERNPFLASSALVNFAALAHRVCLSHSAWNYSVPNPVYGSESCKPEHIISEFLPHLMSKIESSPKEWQKEIYIQAAAMLGTPHVISALRPIILGKTHVPFKARQISLYALGRRTMPASAKEEVFDILMRVIDDLNERSTIRQTAISVLLTWHPDSAWWQRMARLTWREPSQSTAAFFTFTAEKIALSTDPNLRRQASIAAFVLPLMKPFSASMKYSYNYIYSRYDPVSKMGINAKAVYIENPESIIPSDLYVALKSSFGGFKMDVLELALSAKGMQRPLHEFLEAIRTHSGEEESQRPYPSQPRGSESRRAHDMLEKTKEEIGHEGRDYGMPETSIYMKAFDNIISFLPINPETINRMSGPDGENLIEKLLKGKKVHITKYFNPSEFEYFVPTELGLPVVCSVAMPTINYGEAEVKLEVEGMSGQPNIRDVLKAKKVQLLFKSNYRLMTKMFVNISVPVPWEEAVIESGVECFKELNLPMKGDLSYSHSHENKNLTLSLTPITEEAFPLFHAHNIPFTTVRPATPFSTKSVDYKVVAVDKERKTLLNMEKSFGERSAGIKTTLRYDADVPFPFTKAYIMDYLRKPALFMKLLGSPTSRQWQVSLNLHPSESSTKKVSASISYLTPKEESEERKSGRSEGLPDITATDSEKVRLEKLREMSNGRKVRAINAEVSMSGREYRKYEALMAFTKLNKRESSIKEYKTLLALLSVPEERREQKAYCLEIETKTPRIQSFEELKHKVQSGLNEALKGRFTYGRSCSSKSIASFQGQAKVSQERKRLVEEELNHICNFDERNPVVELQTPAVYDEARLDIEYRKEEIPKHLINMTYHVEKLLEGLIWPQGYYNKLEVRNPEGKLSIEAKRPLSSKYYTFWAQKPHENVIVTELPVADFLARVVPFYGLKATKTRFSGLILSRELPSTCVISNNEVTTYDGKRFSYTPLNCYTVAAIQNTGNQDFIIHTRKYSNENFEVRITLPNENVVVEMTKNKIMVNGQTQNEQKKEFKNTNGRVVMIVYKETSHNIAEVVGRLKVKVEDEIQIIPEYTMKGLLRGVCGDFDGRTKFDLTGPKECLFEDTKLFKFAWTISEGENCDTTTLNQERQMVHQFQNNCQKRPTSRNHEKKSSSFPEFAYEKEQASQSCYHHVYPIEHHQNGEKSAICVAEEPVQRCRSECKPVQKNTVQRQAKCWEKEKVPSEVKEAASTGYMKYPVKAPADYSKTIHVRTEKICRRD